eukprot:scaffold1461_cov253-Pinguiococcus_pyrenoidosus.AAC.11
MARRSETTSSRRVGRPKEAAHQSRTVIGVQSAAGCGGGRKAVHGEGSRGAAVYHDRPRSCACVRRSSSCEVMHARRSHART